MKQTNSEQDIQVIRGGSQTSTHTINILFSPVSHPDGTLRPKDLFANGLILEKVGQVFEEVFFNKDMDENLALYCRLIESIGKDLFTKNHLRNI